MESGESSNVGAADTGKENGVKVLITGGGTGGHVFPGIAVAEAIKAAEPECDILFVGGSHGLEGKAVPEAGFAFEAVQASGLLGKRLFAMPVVLWTTLRGFISSLRIVNRFDPDVVFATGGYVSGPVSLAGVLRGKPLVLHEQNSVPGMTNRILARCAREVHLNMPGARRFFSKRRHLKLSGNPIRKTILVGDRHKAREEFGLERDRMTVLILGGSQGARSINRAAVGAVRQLLHDRKELQFVIQTGRRDAGFVRGRLSRYRARVCVRPFIQQMGDAYDLADLVVARAGAMTLTEITVCGKPSILVPFPHATHNHQEANARAMVDMGAAEMILDRDLTPEHLAQTILKFVDTPGILREMSMGVLTLARPAAAEKIAAALLAFGGAVETENGNGRATATTAAGRTRPPERRSRRPRRPEGRPRRDGRRPARQRGTR